MKILRILHVILFLATVSCAMGPTPETVGFNYPEAGLRFRPRRNVVSHIVSGEITPEFPDRHTLIFPRTTSEIESRHRRILITGVEGIVQVTDKPLYDEVSENYFGADIVYRFELTEERTIEVPWNGLESGTGTLRVFRMIPVGETGEEQYTFAVTVQHSGNTIEFCWRDSHNIPPDEEKLSHFFYWTHGMSFRAPEIPE